MNVFQNPVAKKVANYTLAAGVASISMAGFFRVLRHVHGVSAQQSLEHLEHALHDETLDETQQQAMKDSLMSDTSLLDLLDRLREFEGFAADEFRELVKKSSELVAYKHLFEEASAKHNSSFSQAKCLRSKTQDWIESVRLMQAVVEIVSPAVMDDLDDIIADCLKYYKTTNEMALLDVVSR